MAKIIKKHWDITVAVGIGLFLTIAGIVGMLGMISLPSSVSAATTATATVNVQATVAETISITVSSSIMDLGILTDSTVSATSNNFTVKTNAGNGYTVTIKDTGSSTSPGLWKSSAPTNLIPSITATPLTAGSQGYGAQGTSTAMGIYSPYNVSGNNVGQLQITTQNFASSSSATAGAQATLTLKATISATTTAGAYSDNPLTLTAVGSF